MFLQVRSQCIYWNCPIRGEDPYTNVQEIVKSLFLLVKKFQSVGDHVHLHIVSSKKWSNCIPPPQSCLYGIIVEAIRARYAFYNYHCRWNYCSDYVFNQCDYTNEYVCEKLGTNDSSSEEGAQELSDIAISSANFVLKGE